MKEKITIYTGETCPYCKQIKNKLKESSIKFIEKDIIKSKKEWEKVYNLTANPTTPTIEISGEFLLPGRDFQQPEHLVNIINNFQKPTFSVEKLCYERIKNMNWHMANAFQRVDMILKALETKLNTEENEHESTS